MSRPRRRAGFEPKVDEQDGSYERRIGDRRRRWFDRRRPQTTAGRQPCLTQGAKISLSATGDEVDATSSTTLISFVRRRRMHHLYRCDDVGIAGRNHGRRTASAPVATWACSSGSTSAWSGRRAARKLTNDLGPTHDRQRQKPRGFLHRHPHMPAPEPLTPIINNLLDRNWHPFHLRQRRLLRVRKARSTTRRRTSASSTLPERHCRSRDAGRRYIYHAASTDRLERITVHRTTTQIDERRKAKLPAGIFTRRTPLWCSIWLPDESGYQSARPIDHLTAARHGISRNRSARRTDSSAHRLHHGLRHVGADELVNASSWSTPGMRSASTIKAARRRHRWSPPPACRRRVSPASASIPAASDVAFTCCLHGQPQGYPRYRRGIIAPPGAWHYRRDIKTISSKTIRQSPQGSAWPATPVLAITPVRRSQAQEGAPCRHHGLPSAIRPHSESVEKICSTVARNVFSARRAPGLGQVTSCVTC